LLEAQDSGYSGVQILALAHHFLGFLRIVPQIGVFGFGVQLGELADGRIPVKDASLAIQWTASSLPRV
jgi:hypothetical protein